MSIIRIKRRTSGAGGPPAALASAELAYNEIDNILYYGAGNDGNTNATSIFGICGPGLNVTLTGAQTLTGVKTFSNSPIVPTPATNDNSTAAASTAFVQSQFNSITPGTYPKITYNAKGLITGGSALSVADIPSLTVSKISDFQSNILSYQITQFAALTTTFNTNGQMITGIPAPVNPADVVNKQYADNISQGLSAKASVYCSTTTALSAYTVSTNVLTANSNGVLSLDNQSPPTGSRVLVKNETNSQFNGIYILTNTGSASAPFILTRANDFDVWSEVLGAFIFVEFGNVNSGTGWVTNVTATGSVNTTAIAFVQFSAIGSVTPGDGLSKSGNTLSVQGSINRITVSSSGVDISAAYSGQTSITILGTIATGTWKGSSIAVAYGGTGGTTQSSARSGIGAAAAGLNADITSITGLTTMLALSQGGTARDTSGDTDGTLYKKSGSTMIPAVAGTDFSVPSGNYDGGSF